MLELLDQLPIADDERDGLRDDTEDILDAVASVEPDIYRLRALGRSMTEVLGRVGAAAARGTIRTAVRPRDVVRVGVEPTT